MGTTYEPRDVFPELRSVYQFIVIAMSSPDEKHIQTIVRECAEKAGIQVSEKLASMFYKSLVIDPNMNKNVLHNIKKSPAIVLSDAKKIIDRCVDRLTDQKDPVMFCVKMQLFLEDQYKNKEFIVNKVNDENEEKIEPILNDIIVHNPLDGKSGVNYPKLYQYIILTNHMGGATSTTCVRETSAALNNDGIRKKLSDFKKQLPCIERNLLKEIANLVCGIRLYNMDRSSSKEEILDIIDTLPSAIEFLLQNIDQELGRVLNKINKITLWTCQCYKVDSDILAPLFAIRIKFATVGNDELNKYKIILVFYLQYKKNLKTIKIDLNKCKIELIVLLDKYDRTLREIKNYLKKKNKIDEDIFAELINLSSIWSNMIETMNYLSYTYNIILTMKQMINATNCLDKNIKNSPISFDVFTFVSEEQQNTIIKIQPLYPMCKWFSSSSSIIDRKNLFADGYCLVMMVETDGILVKHNENIGVIHYLDDWFGFSCFQAALHFGTKPSFYLNCFYNLLRSQTHLLFFFNLYEQMSNKQYVSNRLIFGKYKYKDAQVQTLFQPHNRNTTDGYINTEEMKKCPYQQINNTLKMTNQNVKTLNVYKSVKVQTGFVDVSTNTMSDKATNTNQLMYHSPIYSGYKLPVEHNI